MGVKLKEIAREAGVSPATLSKVINNRPGVSDEVRMRLLTLLEEKQYQKATPAQMWDGRGGFVNLVLRINQGVSNDPFYTVISQGVAQELQACRLAVRYLVQPACTMDADAFDEAFQNAYNIGNILIGADFSAQVYERLKKLHAPTVLIDSVHADFSSVNPNHADGAQQAVGYLLAQGHRKIAFLSGPLSQGSMAERHRGYCQAMQAAGLAPACCAECAGVGLEDGEQAVMQLGQLGFTALFAATDKLALGAMKALRRRGVQVPRDMSVMGFDDNEWSRYAEPALSTVHVPKTRVGMLAAQLLVNALRDPAMERVTANISTRLVLRDSVRPLPG